MTSPSTRRMPATGAATALTKVPEVTFWFWLIKILCTTVGASSADYVSHTLGLGLTDTALAFAAALVVVGAVQVRLPGHLPPVYWLTVALASVVGTLLADELTEVQDVSLRTSTALFAVVLAAVFAAWYVSEQTVSIHSIDTTSREVFYWLAVLLSVALGTSAGDWTIGRTGWGAGRVALLSAALIALVWLAWRFGAAAVPAFWIAFVLTRPLGAELGDYLGSPATAGGMGLGTLGTSVVFLAAIVLTVLYLCASGVDSPEPWQRKAR